MPRTARARVDTSQYGIVQCPGYFLSSLKDYGGSSHLPFRRLETLSSGKHSCMREETPQVELARLQKEQAKTRQDEVFGGLSWVERSAYDTKQARIYELDNHLSDPDQELQDLRPLWDDPQHRRLQKKF
jgi:hypothetical protein